jgi:hypothetical protein
MVPMVLGLAPALVLGLAPAVNESRFVQMGAALFFSGCSGPGRVEAARPAAARTAQTCTAPGPHNHNH